MNRSSGKTPLLSSFPIAAILCVLTAFLVYTPALKGTFVFDDFSNIVNNEDLRKADAWKIGIFSTRIEEDRNPPSRPVTVLTFLMNYRLHELDPEGYHLFNVLLHCANVFLVLVLSRRVLSGLEGGSSLAWAAALLFAAHPLQSEAVAYISHRTDALAAFFYLLGMLGFLWSCDKNPAYMALSAGAYLLGFGSKEWAITLPIAVALLDFLLLDAPRRPRRWRHALLWAMAVALIVFRKIYIGRIGFLGAQIDQVWTPGSYLVTQCWVWLKYLALWVLPLGQTFDHYIVRGAPGLAQKAVAAACLFGAGVIALAYKIHRAGIQKAASFVRGEGLSLSRKIAAFGLVFAAVVLAPTSTFFPAYEAMAERRMYMAGWGLALAWVVFWRSLVKSARLFWTLIALQVLLFSGLTWNRSRLYQNPLNLWREAVSRYPNNPRAHNNLGVLYMRQDDTQTAMHHFLHVIENDPNGAASAYNNLGEIYYRKGEVKKALAYFQEASNRDPKMHYAWRNMGDSYFELGRLSEAESCYLKAIELKPKDAELSNNLGLIYLSQKKTEQAIEAFLKSAELDPDFVAPRMNLADLYIELERLPEALRQLDIWSSLDPENPEITQKIRILRDWMSQKARRKK